MSMNWDSDENAEYLNDLRRSESQPPDPVEGPTLTDDFTITRTRAVWWDAVGEGDEDGWYGEMDRGLLNQPPPGLDDLWIPIDGGPFTTALECVWALQHWLDDVDIDGEGVPCHPAKLSHWEPDDHSSQKEDRRQ